MIRTTHGIVCIICLFLSLIFEWWVRQCGFIHTPDSFNYLSSALSFKTSGNFLSPDGSAFTNWPPLFPMFLSLFDSPQEIMIGVNVICKSVIAYGVYTLANRYLGSSLGKSLFLLSFFISVHFLLISVFLWSELIFMMLLLIHIVLVEGAEKNRWKFALLLISGFLLCIQRNAGLFLVLGIAGWMFFYFESSLKNHLKIFTYLFFSVIGLLLWHVYNVSYVSSDSFIGRPFFSDSLLNIKLIADSHARFYLPINGYLATLLGVCMGLILFWLWIRYFSSNKSLNLIITAIIVYTGGFVPIPNLEFNDMERYFAVILPLFLLCLFWVFEYLLSNRLAVKWITLICLSFWLFYTAARTWQNALQWRQMSCTTPSIPKHK